MAEEKNDVQQTLAIIKPNALASANEILDLIKLNGFTIVQQKRLRLTQEKAEGFYAEHKGKGFFGDLVKFMTSDDVVVLKLERPNAIKAWRDLMGPTNYETARKEAPNSIRSLYGKNMTENASHGSDSPQSSARELNYFFPVEQTLAIIKPNAIPSADKILEKIKGAGFTIVDQQRLKLTSARAEAFYAEHKGKGFFGELVGMMTSDDVIVLRLEKENAIADWRKLMGPTKVEVAKKEAPDSIRALFGKNVTENAAHGSDSPASAAREIKFFFSSAQTLAIVKPNALKNVDEITAMIANDGFRIVERRQYTLTKERAEAFYAEHKGKGFFDELVKFMTSGDCVFLRLERANAVLGWRQLMGPTKVDVAKKDAPWSVRAKFGKNVTENASHGSDSPLSAARELQFFFGIEQTLAIIKPNALEASEKIIAQIKADGFTVVQQQKLRLTKQRAEGFYAEHKGKKFFDELVGFMTSDDVTVLKLERENAVKAWRTLMGPTNVETARKEAPKSVRALYGKNMTENASHGSDAPWSAARELHYFFGYQSTLALIKPNAFAKRNDILDIIRANGFVIAQQQSVTLSKAQCEEFYAEHQGKGFFDELVGFMVSGPTYAMELSAPGAILKWRAVMGPTNSDTAKLEAPKSIRALFGDGATKNASHGSDAVESAARELNLWFGAKGFTA